MYTGGKSSPEGGYDPSGHLAQGGAFERHQLGEMWHRVAAILGQLMRRIGQGGLGLKVRRVQGAKISVRRVKGAETTTVRKAHA